MPNPNTCVLDGQDSNQMRDATLVRVGQRAFLEGEHPDSEDHWV
jgi:hypothetical protein